MDVTILEIYTVYSSHLSFSGNRPHCVGQYANLYGIISNLAGTLLLIASLRGCSERNPSAPSVIRMHVLLSKEWEDNCVMANGCLE